MHDIRAIRDNPEAYVAGWSSRGVEGAAEVVVRILALDVDLRAAQTTGQEALAKRNAASKAIGAAMGKKDMAEADRLKAEVETLKTDIAEAGEAEAAKGAELRDLLAGLKNTAADNVPDGEDENDNVEVLKWGEPRTTGPAKDHSDLGEAMGLLDFEAAAKMSGSRFAVLKGQLARLERAIGQFMLDLQTGTHGYLEVNPPFLVKDDAMFGTGQLPKFEDDLFKTEALDNERISEEWLAAARAARKRDEPELRKLSERLRNVVDGDDFDAAWEAALGEMAEQAIARDTPVLIARLEAGEFFRASLPHPDRRSLPDQPRARADPGRGRGGRAHASDGADALLPGGGRVGGARYARPDPSASVFQGRDGLHLSS